MNNSFESRMGALESWLAPIFAKAPHIPESARKTISDIAPWLALIFGILGLLASVTGSALSLLLSPFILLGGGMYGIMTFVGLALAIISSILDLLAFNPLRSHRKLGWNLLFYATVINAVYSILGMLFMSDGNIGGILGAIIGLWLLFEIRSMYHA